MLDSGLASGSRIGFRGTEMLGNGLKAGFVLEQGILADTGGSAQGGRTFGRQAFVSLGGAFGSVALGRQYAPGYLLTSDVDPFASGTVGQYNNVYLTEYRWDNQISYTTPSWGGLSVLAGYTLDVDGDESAANRGSGDIGDVRGWAIVPQYRSGAVVVVEVVVVGAWLHFLERGLHGLTAATSAATMASAAAAGPQDSTVTAATAVVTESAAIAAAMRRATGACRARPSGVVTMELPRGLGAAWGVWEPDTSIRHRLRRATAEAG